MENKIDITDEDIQHYYRLSKKRREIDIEMKYLKNKFHQYLDDTIGKNQKGDIQRGNYKIERQVRSVAHYDEALTVGRLTSLNMEELIITVRKPDTEKLEAAIKVGLLDEKEFDTCKKTKITQAIVVKESV